MYLPPLVRFCDAIVGRIIPPREFGASGSESLYKNLLTENLEFTILFEANFILFFRKKKK